MGDYGTDFQPVENPLEHVGYCPQVNPLWPRITLLEHLEIFAAIKGLHQHDIPNIIKRYTVVFLNKLIFAFSFYIYATIQRFEVRKAFLNVFETCFLQG